MFSMLWLACGSLFWLFRSRRDLILEYLVLRQQLAVLKRHRSRPTLQLSEKLFWVTVSRLWSQWKRSLIVITPETVVRWHRAGFRMYWRLLLLSARTNWSKGDAEGGAGVDLPHGGREADSGSAAHLWGTADARIRHLGTNHLALMVAILGSHLLIAVLPNVSAGELTFAHLNVPEINI